MTSADPKMDSRPLVKQNLYNSWNGSLGAPTLLPSLLAVRGDGDHWWVGGGRDACAVCAQESSPWTSETVLSDKLVAEVVWVRQTKSSTGKCAHCGWEGLVHSGFAVSGSASRHLPLVHRDDSSGVQKCRTKSAAPPALVWVLWSRGQVTSHMRTHVNINCHLAHCDTSLQYCDTSHCTI